MTDVQWMTLGSILRGKRPADWPDAQPSDDDGLGVFSPESFAEVRKDSDGRSASSRDHRGKRPAGKDRHRRATLCGSIPT